MMAVFDYRCLKSGEVVERFVRKSECDAQTCSCGSAMQRQVAGTRTTFRFADTKLKK